jgi:hypothetical protein
MTQVKELKCKDLVGLEYTKEINRLKEIFSLPTKSQIVEAVRSQHLCYDLVEANTFTDQPEAYYRLQISWGGPSDEFRFFVSSTGILLKTEYWFMDWFDGAKKDVKDVIGQKWARLAYKWFSTMANPFA